MESLSPRPPAVDAKADQPAHASETTHRPDGSSTHLNGQASQLLRAVEAAQLGTFDWDVTSDKLFWNQRHQSLWGYRDNEFGGTYAAFIDRVHPEDAEVIHARLVRCRLSGESFNHEYRVRWPDGTIVWVQSSGAVVLDESGEAIRINGVTQDITKRRRAAEDNEHQASLIRAMLDTLPDEVFYKNESGHYIGCNASFAARLGRTRADILGKTDFDLFDSAEAERIIERDRQTMAWLNSRHHDEWITYPGGRRALLETLTTPYRGPDGKALGVLGISRDITVKNRDLLIQNVRTHLLAFAPDHTLEELLIATLDQVEVLTQSEIGFFHFLEADQVTLSLQAWSTRTTREMCKAEGKGRHYNVNAAGVWVDCIRERRAVIHNDYAALQHRRGLPPGHAAVLRELVVPVIRQGLIVCIIGVGNKRTDYTDEEVTVVSRVADFVWDIVERKRAEIALSDNAARLRLALVAANQGLFDINLQTGTATVSPEYATMLGYDPSTFVETVSQWRTRLHPEDLSRADEALAACIEGQANDYRVEFRMATANGGWKWILSMGRIVERTSEGRPRRMIGTHTDISEAKLAENALRDSEERHRHLVETSADWVWEIDSHARYTYASERVRDLLGYAPSEILGRTVFELMPPQEAERTRPLILEGIAAGKPFVGFENTCLHKDGRTINVETNGVPVFNASGELIGYRGMDRDVTARRAVERQLRLRDAALQAAANSIVITDRHGRIEWANAAFTTSSGWQLSEVIGRNPRELIWSGQHGREFFTQMWDTISNGRVWRGEIMNRRKDGALRTEDMTITPLFDENGTISHYIAIKQDITERKQLEAQTRHSQRMEALGAMAGGIAHDLNNILTPIGMVAGLLRDDRTDEKSRELLSLVEQSAKRGGNIIQQLLTFSRGVEGERLPLRLQLVLKEVLALARETFPREISLSLSLPPELPLVLADATQIHQVVLNLCVNARDAMPSGGQLALIAETETLDRTSPKLPEHVQPGEFVVLHVCDSGTGIAPDLLLRIFDPFFTTKPVNRGTGLGLSTVQGIVRSHGGFITVDSTLGKGTTFSVHLPSAGPESVPESVSHEAPMATGRGELILVVEDEIDIGEAAQMGLEACGYRVRLALNGRDGLDQFTKYRAEISMILTDLMMPVMKGTDFVRAVREIDPHIPIAVATGLKESAQQRELEALGVHDILSKPYSYGELTQLVEKKLASRRR